MWVKDRAFKRGSLRTVFNQGVRLFVMPRRYERDPRTGLTEVARQQEIVQEKPPPLGNVPRGVALKGAGVALPQDAGNGRYGPFIPFRKAWEEQRAWHREGK